MTLQAGELDAIWRMHSRKVLATLIRLLGDFDLAEEALHDAFVIAAQKWPLEGVPDNAAAWLVSAGRFRALDQMRRKGRLRALVQGEIDLAEAAEEAQAHDEALSDDLLRLIFTACHPDLPAEGQVALTLRAVCGLTTEDIARAFLVSTPTIAQRIVRAKARIREAGLRYEVPAAEHLSERLGRVLSVIYLLFNEGYLSHSGDTLQRPDLMREAIRLTRLLASLLPDGEVLGLLGLMLIHDARKSAREDALGEVIPLDAQDRSAWDQALIAEGRSLVERAFASGQVGPFALQGAIAVVHATAPSLAATDWREILGLYTVLLRLTPSPVVALNRAVAYAMVHGAAAALELIEPLLADKALVAYHPAHTAHADLLERLDRHNEARAAYQRALDLCTSGPQRGFLQRRIEALDARLG